MAQAEDDARFIWYELATTDARAAEAFYTQVVGWNAQPFPGPTAIPYTVLFNGTTGVGGLMKLPPAVLMPPTWLPYVATRAIRSRVERALSLGANLQSPPQTIPTVGTIAVLSDPQGATFALIEPTGPGADGAPREAEVGEISWHELGTTDPGAAADFYCLLFGWEKVPPANDTGALGVYYGFARRGVPTGGIFRSPAGNAPHWLVYARVSDLRARAETARSLGAELLHGPAEIAGGDLVCQMRDPMGALFALHQAA
jgi:predicted enzyme related to lactoylglutathione lyase